MKTLSEYKVEIRNIFLELSQERELSSIDFDGKLFLIYPQVFSPKIFSEGHWFGTELSKLVGKGTLLEVGTGTGIIACICARNGSTVEVTDINPLAVENAKVNFGNLGFSIPAYQGDVFSGIPSGKAYDALFWNHPFHRGESEEAEILLQSIFDFEYRALERYIAGSNSLLSPSGRLFLGTATMAEIPYIEELAKRYGRTAVEIARSNCDMTCNDFDLTCLILELKREYGGYNNSTKKD